MKISAQNPMAIHPSTASKLQAAAVELEATFLAEMLKSAGLGKSRAAMNGGAGEDQFSSMLVQHQARHLAQAGGVGLSEAFFNAMMEKADDK